MDATIVSPFNNLKCPECKSQCLHAQITAVVNANQRSGCEFKSSMIPDETLSYVWDEVYTWCCQCEWEGDINECETATEAGTEPAPTKGQP